MPTALRFSCALLILAGPIVSIAQESTTDSGRWYDLVRGQERIEIYRDAWGMPHVYSDSFEGIWFGQGYVTAEDRLWQMEKSRRDAKGEFAEIGLWRIEEEVTRADAIGHDEFARRSRYSEAERRYWMKWIDPSLVAMLENYRDGVNAFIQRARAEGELPPAYERLGIEPRPWDVSDSLAITEAFHARLGEADVEALLIPLIRRELIELHGEETGLRIYNDVFDLYDPDAPSTLPRSEVDLHGAVPDIRKYEDNGLSEEPIDLGALLRIHRALKEEKRIARALGLFSGWEGHTWVASRRRTLNRNALLYADLSFGFSSPSAVHEVHLNGPSSRGPDARINVSGIAVVGIPAILMGVSDQAAWSILPGKGHVSEYFFERLDQTQGRHYAYGGAWFAFKEREEIVRVWNGDGDLQEISYPVAQTQHGPILDMSDEAPLAFSVHHPWWQEWGECLLTPLFSLSSMSEYDDFHLACASFQTSLNIFYADVRGNIGYQWAGSYPIHNEGHDPRLPSLGTGLHEPMAGAGYGGLPKVENPRTRHLGGWGARTIDEWPDWYSAIWPGNDVYDRFKGRRDLTLAEFAGIAEDITHRDYLAEYLADLVQQVESHPLLAGHALAPRAVQLLIEPGNSSRAADITHPFYQRFARLLLSEIFVDEVPFIFENADPKFTLRTLGRLMKRVLAPDAPGAMRSLYLEGRDRADVIASALIRTVEAMGVEFGDNVATWNEPPSPSEEEFGYRTKSDGSPSRGTYLMVIELSEPVTGYSVLLPGQDEDPQSPHAADQLHLDPRSGLKPIHLDRPPR